MISLLVVANLYEKDIHLETIKIYESQLIEKFQKLARILSYEVIDLSKLLIFKWIQFFSQGSGHLPTVHHFICDRERSCDVSLGLFHYLLPRRSGM